MTALATTSQLRDRLQDPNLDEGFAMQALLDASGLVRGVSGQEFSFVSQETVLLAGGRPELTLPQAPAVVDDDNPLLVVELADYGTGSFTAAEGTNFRRVGDRLLWLSGLTSAPIWRRGPGWASWVQVTYSHGYKVIPDWLTAIVLDVAQVFATNPTGLRSRQVGAMTDVYSNESLAAPAALMADIAAKLAAVGAISTAAFTVDVAATAYPYSVRSSGWYC